MLEGDKVVLIPITNEDTDSILGWRNQRFVREKFIDQEILTQEVHENWMKTMVSVGKVKQFIIYVKLGMERNAIGSAYLKDIDKNSKKAEYGIFIGEKDYLGRGFGSDAAKVLLEYAFETLSLHKVTLRVLASNKCAIASYKKAGFVEEGYFKDEIKIKNRYQDIIFMAVFH